MPSLNWEIIELNISEAREQLQQIEVRIKAAERIPEVEFQIPMQHAYPLEFRVECTPPANQAVYEFEPRGF